jgi:hypothetical protein
LADLVRTDRHNHRPIAGDSAQVEGIKVLARGHQNLIWARTRHTNQLRNALREYYPGALEAFSDLVDRDALAILGRAPIPTLGARLSINQIRSRPPTRWPATPPGTSAPPTSRRPCAASSSPLLPGLGVTLGARVLGDLHHQALRALANRLVGILHGCLRHHTLYNEDTAWAHRQPTNNEQAA